MSRDQDALLLAEIREMAANGEARAVRISAHLTQQEVAKTCKVTAAAVLLWETGKRIPRGEPALQYARLITALRQVKVAAQ